MRTWTTLLLLCLGFLAGCSKQDNKHDAANPSAPSLSEAKALSLPPIPDPMDADAIMKIWAMDHDETDFMEEMKMTERPGTWKGKRRMGSDKNNLEQSQEFSFSAKLVNHRFMTWKFSGEGIPPAYSVMTYLPEKDSYYWWETEESGAFNEYKGKKTERGGIGWESVVWPSGEGNTLKLSMIPGPDGLLLQETVQVMKDGEVLMHGEGEAHWMSGPGMKPLSAKEIQELLAEPHDPNWEVPEIASLIIKPGAWKGVDKIRVRKEEEPLEAAKSLLEGAKDLLQLGEADDQPQEGEQEEMERILFATTKYVRGRFAVYTFRDSEGEKLYSGVTSYDSRANLLIDSVIDLEGVLQQRAVGVPDAGKGEVRWKSLPHEDHDRLFTSVVRVSPDRKKSSFKVKVKGRENGRLLAVIDGQMEWLGELPKEE